MGMEQQQRQLLQQLPRQLPRKLPQQQLRCLTSPSCEARYQPSTLSGEGKVRGNRLAALRREVVVRLRLQTCRSLLFLTEVRWEVLFLAEVLASLLTEARIEVPPRSRWQTAPRLPWLSKHQSPHLQRRQAVVVLSQ